MIHIRASRSERATVDVHHHRVFSSDLNNISFSKINDVIAAHIRSHHIQIQTILIHFICRLEIVMGLPATRSEIQLPYLYSCPFLSQSSSFPRFTFEQ